MKKQKQTYQYILHKRHLIAKQTRLSFSLRQHQVKPEAIEI